MVHINMYPTGLATWSSFLIFSYYGFPVIYSSFIRLLSPIFLGRPIFHIEISKLTFVNLEVLLFVCNTVKSGWDGNDKTDLTALGIHFIFDEDPGFRSKSCTYTDYLR